MISSSEQIDPRQTILGQILPLRSDLALAAVAPLAKRVKAVAALLDNEPSIQKHPLHVHLGGYPNLG
jgi:hypothetical protein